jgi:CheY-like chemotaxis protein
MQRDRAVDASRIHDMMERQLGYLVRLVDDLLEMSRINQGTLELRRERVTLASVVSAAVETSEPLIREAGHHLDVAMPQVPVWIDGDPVRLGQIASNLLNNAARYTERGGHIWLSAEVRRDRVTLSVRDTGIGFAPEAAAGFFELFHRGSQSKGLGIGLTIARRLAEMHGGTIRASSEGPGRGACFTLELPLASAPAAVTEPPAAARGLARQRVLIVDDNEDAADSLGMLLDDSDCEVRIAHSGREALTMFEQFDPVLRPARHRHAGHGRIRGGARDQKPPRRAPPCPDRVHRLGPGDRSRPGARGRFRPPPRQADGPPYAEDAAWNRPRRPLIVAGTQVLGPRSSLQAVACGAVERGAGIAEA